VKLGTAADLAELLGTSRDHVYDHAEFYGAIRLGGGPKAPLRFDLDAVMERLTFPGRMASEEAGERMVAPVRRRRRAASAHSTVPLLPILGRSGVPT
jgi:hypothetical protein